MSLRRELVEIITKIDQEQTGGDSVDFAGAVADAVLEHLSHSSLPGQHVVDNGSESS